ncbi:M60 family metallopeptidase [Sphingobacterium sp. 1.A.4]|uniref:M60 family metallopeptidase n=1 Tax=Sphingobacterium sp. 1.A.4 TaxID=2044603 RepID=UPI000C0C086B|nr:M60 family metallopeptidase [Sphingobacterium sp. 1.A.4]
MMKKLAIISFLICASNLTFAQSENDLSFFNKKNLTTLARKANQQAIQEIQHPVLREVANQIKNGKYPLAERFKTYESFFDPKILAKELKTSPYSQFENPTGIYFSANEEVLVWVEENENQKLNLLVTNWDDEHFRMHSYPLKAGLNKFQVKDKGNSYIQHFYDEGKPFKKLKIHILSGKINGVFDARKDDNNKYQKMLSSAYGPVIDLVGKKVHLAYSKESLKKGTPENGKGLVALYDSIIRIQHEIMGLVKYKKEPKNHMFGRVIWKGFMHADGLGAAFHDNTMKDLANINRLRKNSWGVAHEFGHVNQVRPNMKWTGTTEVTNNIYSVWTQYLYNSHSPKLEHEKLKDYDEPKIGGRITAYMESAFVHNQPWLTQAGPDRWDRERKRDWGGDHFVKLVPLWQLQLYFHEVGAGKKWGNKDFYGDIFYKAIQEPVSDQESESYYQLQFVKNACKMSGLDLTDFFKKSGILAPIDLIVDDYTVGRMKITEADIKEVEKYASQFPKPSSPVIHYLTANSINIFKDQEELKGNINEGFSKEKDRLIIDNLAWPGAVAFETYQGDKLVKVAFRGAGFTNNQHTIVHLPIGSTKVKAIGWNGEKIDVI